MDTPAVTRTPARRRAPIGAVITALVFELIYWATVLIGRALSYGMLDDIVFPNGIVLSVVWSFLPIVAALVACKVRESRRLIGVGVFYAAVTAGFANGLFSELSSSALAANDYYLWFRIAYFICSLLLMLNAFAFRKKALFIIPMLIICLLLTTNAYRNLVLIIRTLISESYDDQFRRSYLLFQAVIILSVAGTILLHVAMTKTALLRLNPDKTIGGDKPEDDGANDPDGSDGGFGGYEDVDAPASEDVIIF